MEETEVNRLYREIEWLKIDRLEEIRLRISLQERIAVLEKELQIRTSWWKLLKQSLWKN